MIEKCTVCHESSQQAVIREGFPEELLLEQIGRVKGGLKPLTLACKSQLHTFFPNSAFSDQIGNLKSVVALSIHTSGISKPYKPSFFPLERWLLNISQHTPW